jgi:hypothetical protein
MQAETHSFSVYLPLTKTERDKFEKLADGRPLTALLRDLLKLDPAIPGRRWPADPAERRLRTRETAEA